jgi:hypothetical protein
MALRRLNGYEDHIKAVLLEFTRGTMILVGGSTLKRAANCLFEGCGGDV